MTLIGVSSAIRDLRDEAACAAECDAGVLVAGEAGSGKKFLARVVHRQSDRANGPFVVVTCAMREGQLEQLLFGQAHRNGHKPSALEDAHGGVLFLDAIGELTATLQGRLMRFFDTREVPSSGAYALRRQLDVRIICSTRVALTGLMEAGAFREDLYYRLNAMYLEIPPLRDRRSDVDPLLEHFTTQHASRRGVQPPKLTGEWRPAFDAHEWRDNVRELEGVADRLVVNGRL